MHGQPWTFTVRMLKHGKFRSHKTIGHVPFLRARFPVAIIEEHRQVSDIRASWFLGYFRDVFLPGFPLSSLSLEYAFSPIFLRVRFIARDVASYD